MKMMHAIRNLIESNQNFKLQLHLGNDSEPSENKTRKLNINVN